MSLWSVFTEPRKRWPYVAFVIAATLASVGFVVSVRSVDSSELIAAFPPVPVAPAAAAALIVAASIWPLIGQWSIGVICGLAAGIATSLAVILAIALVLGASTNNSWIPFVFLFAALGGAHGWLLALALAAIGALCGAFSDGTLAAPDAIRKQEHHDPH